MTGWDQMSLIQKQWKSDADRIPAGCRRDHHSSVVSDEVVNLAWDLGIPVFWSTVDMPDSDRICYMGKDFREQAELLLDHIEERVDPDTELRIAIQVAESRFTIAQEQIRQIEEVFA